MAFAYTIMRLLLQHERPLVAYLFELAAVPISIDKLLVKPMVDGGMGSLLIAPFVEGRRLGSTTATCHFYDLDNVPVCAELNLDRSGKPFAIDVWKVDFTPTVSWPSRSKLKKGMPDS